MSEQIPLITTEPKPEGTRELVAWFVDEARKRGATVPRRVIGQTAKHVKELLDEGIGPEKVRAGLHRMLERDIIQPRLLPQLTMEASIPVKDAFRRTVETTVPDDNSHLDRYFGGAISDEERRRVAGEMREAAKRFGHG